MTRENKLALVIGFGLVLFVGILISDHFSTARNQESADLRANRATDPLMQDRHRNPRLFDVNSTSRRSETDRIRPTLQAGPVAMNTGRIEPIGEGSTSAQNHSHEVRQIDREDEASSRIVMGQPTDLPAQSATDDRNFTVHVVQRGESLTSIARHHYGDGSLMRGLAQYNNLSDPNRLRVGDRVRIPPAAQLRNGAAAPQRDGESRGSATEQRPSQEVYTKHTVQRGETLSEISQKLLGSARRWREIHEMNRDVIRDPDNVPAGTELKIPRP